jgi:membrane-bound inhibitor of C-type lysozyme
MQKFLTSSLIVAGLTFSMSFNTVHASDKNAELATAGHVSALYQCDLGDKLTVYRNADDNSYVNLRWRNKMYRMNRQQTSTGAERYENKNDGLVLISIPSKSMLFDSRKGRQLANECRNPEQTRRLASRK